MSAKLDKQTLIALRLAVLDVSLPSNTLLDRAVLGGVVGLSRRGMVEAEKRALKNLKAKMEVEMRSERIE